MVNSILLKLVENEESWFQLWCQYSKAAAKSPTGTLPSPAAHPRSQNTSQITPTGNTLLSLAPFLPSLSKSNLSKFAKFLFSPPYSKFSFAFHTLTQQEQPCTSCEPQPTSQAPQGKISIPLPDVPLEQKDRKCWHVHFMNLRLNRNSLVFTEWVFL